ncbi:MAG: hypothetical protein LC731_04380, partial [Acidobacteria bacterium]|nr:hypothetical protein [Acidobacteriota bacterium]
HTQAISLLIETADSARAFKDLNYRARIQAIAADALWDFDEMRARQIFRRAWEAATAADRAEQRVLEEEAGIVSNSNEVTMTAARDEVLSKAAARDARLAETFLRELADERERMEGSKGKEAGRRTPWRELSPSGARRLALAYELLNEGNYVRASQVVEPLFNEGVSGDLVEFLLRFKLRTSDRDANPSGMHGGTFFLPTELYIRLIAKAASDRNTDANDVLLLSSFVISPNLLMVVDERGGLQFRSIAAQASKNVQSSALPTPLYKLSVAVLSQRGPGNIQERTARYVAMGRLLPFFERGGPEYAQFVPVMRSQMATLSAEMDAGRRDALTAQFELT